MILGTRNARNYSNCQCGLYTWHPFLQANILPTQSHKTLTHSDTKLHWEHCSQKETWPNKCKLASCQSNSAEICRNNSLKPVRSSFQQQATYRNSHLISSQRFSRSFRFRGQTPSKSWQELVRQVKNTSHTQ